MLLSNENVIVLSDAEAWLAVTGAGLQFLIINAEFKTTTHHPVVQTVISDSAVLPKKTSISSEQIRNRRL